MCVISILVSLAMECKLSGAIRVIPATKHCSQMLVTNNGRWDTQGGATLGDSAGYSGGARGREFPFRPGTVWEKQFSGRHASAVRKSELTIQFEIIRDEENYREGGGTSGRVVCVGQGGMVTRRFRGNFISCTHSQYASRYMTISCSMIIR